MAENPFVVGLALLGFFPLGLYLVWHHPHWTKTRKWSWTGAWLGCFCLMMVPAVMAPRAVPNRRPSAAQIPYDISGEQPSAYASALQPSGPSSPRLRSDEELIQGRWNDVGPDETEKPQFEFRGDEIIETSLGLSEPSGKFILDPNQHPKQIT